MIILATNNANKVNELKNLLRDENGHCTNVFSLSDLGLVFVPAETGNSFEENAMQKATETADFLREKNFSAAGLNEKNFAGKDFSGDDLNEKNFAQKNFSGDDLNEKNFAQKNFVVLADDSGLEIDALGGEPGVDSANFMGRETPYAVRNDAIIKRLADVPPERRTARFVCVIAAVFSDGKSLFVRGEIDGVIAREQKGTNGFGYDPIFFLPERGKTTAELSDDEKNAISHRGIALRKMVEALAGCNF